MCNEMYYVRLLCLITKNCVFIRVKFLDHSKRKIKQINTIIVLELDVEHRTLALEQF